MAEEETKGMKNHLYVIFRIIVGLLFFMHGSQKLFGWFGSSSPTPLVSLMGVVGIIEIVAGIAIAFGILTRLAAFGGLVVMIGAYTTAHLPKGLWPYQNGGELALMYLAAFLVLLAYGSNGYTIMDFLKEKPKPVPSQPTQPIETTTQEPATN